MRIYRRCGVADHDKFEASADSGVDAGMSLVEVVVAITIIAIGVLGLLSSLVTGARSQTLEKSQATAIHLATGALEAASYLPYSSLSSAAGTATKPVNGISYTETTTVAVGSGTASTTSVGIVVSWTAVGKAHSVTMQRNFANQSSTTTSTTTTPLGSCGGSGLSVVTGSLSVSPSKVTVNSAGATTAPVTLTLTETGLSLTNTSCIPLTWSDDNGAHQASMTPGGGTNPTYSYTIPTGSIVKASSGSAGSVTFTATVPTLQVQPTATLQTLGQVSFGTCAVQVSGQSANAILINPSTRNTTLLAGVTCTTSNLTSADSVTGTYQSGSTTRNLTLSSSDGSTWTGSIAVGSAMVSTGGSEGFTFTLTRALDAATANKSLSATLVSAPPGFSSCSVQALGLSLNTITLVPLTRNTLLAATLTCTTTNLIKTDAVTATYQSGSTTKTISMSSADGTTWTATLPSGSAMISSGLSEGLTFKATRAVDSATASQPLTVVLA